MRQRGIRGERKGALRTECVGERGLRELLSAERCSA